MKNLKILARVRRELAGKKGKFLALTCLENSLVGHISRGCSDHGPEITTRPEQTSIFFQVTTHYHPNTKKRGI